MPHVSLVLALLLVALAGCDNPLTDLPGAITDPGVLVSVEEWVAVSAVSDGRSHRFPDDAFTIRFRPDGYVGGRASANGYGGRYVALPNGRLRVEELVTTLVGESPERTRLAGVLLTEVREATWFGTQDGVLQVQSEDGDGVRFERR